MKSFIVVDSTRERPDAVEVEVTTRAANFP